MFLPAGPLKHELPPLLGQGKLRQELSAVHHPTLPAFSVGMSPREVREHQLGWKQHPAHCILLTPPSHSPSCFGCQGPPAAPPPASESSRPVRDLPAKNKPHLGPGGWKQNSQRGFTLSHSVAAWSLGPPQRNVHLHCASVSPPRATTASAGQEALGKKAGGNNCLISPGNGKQSLASAVEKGGSGLGLRPCQQAGCAEPATAAHRGRAFHPH